MRVADILRQLADVVDQTEQAVDTVGQEAGTDQAVPAEQPVTDGGETGSGEITITQLEPVNAACGEEAESETMVSPLQQEHELLKKSQDVENHVAEFAGDEGQVAENSAEEQEWSSAMGHDGDDPEEMIGSPDEEEVDEDAELARMKQLAHAGESNKPHNYAESAKPVSVNPRAEAAKQFNRNRKS